MPEFQVFTGTVLEIRDARGPHPLVFGADEEGEALRTLAPGVFAGGGGTPVMCSFGQFTSVILEALARLPSAGGPAAGSCLGTHRCTTIFLRRVWSTALAIVGRMHEGNRLAFWSPAQRGPFIVRLAALRKSATPAELNAFYLMDADLEPVRVDPAASGQPDSAGMTMWWRNAEWQLGGLADEERGTLEVAGRCEYYADGRLDFATGLGRTSEARAFAESVDKASERAALATGHTMATWSNVPVAVRAQKALAFLARGGWPVQLDHWKATTLARLADMDDLFVYMECGGVGRAAERELLGAPARTRIALAQLLPLYYVVCDAPGGSLLHAALRRLVQAATSHSWDSTFVTLDAMIGVNEMLAKSTPQCSGPEFAAKEFSVRIDEGVQLCELRRGVAMASSSGFGAFAGSALTDAKGGVVGGYDKARLLDLKGSAEYMATKRQVLEAVSLAQVDKAILLALRGAEGLPASGAAAAPRLAPLKLFADMLLGTKDVYTLDKELDGAVTEMRRVLPSFWGRRVCKALGITLRQDVPLKELAKVMEDTSKWEANPPDFYALALVPIRVAAGADAASLYASHHHAVDSPPYENIAVIGAVSLLGAGLLSDIGVTRDAVDDVSAPGVDIASPTDLFTLAEQLHSTLGQLETTPARMAELITSGLSAFGLRRAAVRSCQDPLRALNTRLVEPGAEFLSSFYKKKDLLKVGQDTAAGLLEAGFKLASSVAPTPPATLPTLPSPIKPRAAGKRPLNTVPPGTPEPEPEPSADTVIKLTHGGDRVHVAGGERGPLGCQYMLAGPEGLAAAANPLGICGAYLVALKTRPTDKAAVDKLCGNAAHRAGSEEHPVEAQALFEARHIKLAEYRVNADGSKFVRPVTEVKGKGKGGKRSKGGKGGKGAKGLLRAVGAAALVVAADASVVGAPGLAAPLRPGHGPGRGDAAWAANCAFSESTALFVADGNATLPEHLGGGGLLDWLLRDVQGAARRPFDVVVCEHTGSLRGELDALDCSRGGCLGSAISIDKRPSETPGLHYCGDAQDLLYKRSWRRLFSFAPCTDDALSGAQYFPEKAEDGRLFRGAKFFVWTMCAPAQAAMAEHPRSVLKHFLDWPYQITQPHQFGLGETGLSEQKETWLFWRGWPDIAPTDPLPGPHVSRIKMVRAASASDRDALKSRPHPGMMRAIAMHATVASIAPSRQPDFEAELRKLGERFADRYGDQNLPMDWKELHARSPAWVATSIDYAPSPNAREGADPGVVFVGAQRPGASAMTTLSKVPAATGGAPRMNESSSLQEDLPQACTCLTQNRAVGRACLTRNRAVWSVSEGVITGQRSRRVPRRQNKKYLTSIPLKGDVLMYTAAVSKKIPP